MGSTKETLGRINSVKNTKKITRAMELVAASKMRKAVEAVLQTRSYANLSWLTLRNVVRMARHDKKMHELLHERDMVNKVGVILISSNKGLCGGYNSFVLKEAEAYVKENFENSDVSFIVLGKKGKAIESRFKRKIDKYFDIPDSEIHISNVEEISKYVIDKYLSVDFDEILLVYTDYISSTRQRPRVKRLLPLHLEKFDTHLGEVDFGDDVEKKEKEIEEMMEEKQKKYFSHVAYEFEPNPYEVLDKMLPKFINIQIFQALLEASASEHNQRMIAMHSATDAASDMIDDLTLAYNKARQAAITTSISEIVSGAEGLNK